MNSRSGNWTRYTMGEVVDVDGPRLSVRNYIEQRDLREHLSRIENRESIRTAVEFGCGFGRMTQVLTEFAPEVIGLEREPEFLEQASRLIPDVRFIQADDLSVPVLEASSCDLVITFTFLQHMIDEKAQETIQQIIRCARSPGHVLICEESDASLCMGEIDNPRGRCTIGRAVETYSEYFKPLELLFTAPRRVEPDYHRDNTGTYMLFRKSG